MYAVLSDVHSNLEALKSVLQDLKNRGIYNIYFIGDAVGYGSEPDECIKLLRTECNIILAGNHDWGVCGLTDIGYFNEYARAAIEWTKGVISIENLDALKSFPALVEDKAENITLVHSTPFEPEKWHYLLKSADAVLNFQCFDTKLCFIGHTHRPVIIERHPSGELITNKDNAGIRGDSRYIINAGSIGQPRDGDPRASYAVIDDEKVQIIRVPYNIEATQKKMALAGLPLFLIERIAQGM